MKRNQIKKMVFGALLCALVFVATLISIPAPAVGNINLGDGVLLLGVWMLGGVWSVIAAAAGAMLCDLISGAYAIYAPGTFVIKALMATVALLLQKKLPLSKRISAILSAVAAEAVMIGGYFVYEAWVLSLGVAVAAANIPFNAIQGGCAIIIFTVFSELAGRIRVPH